MDAQLMKRVPYPVSGAVGHTIGHALVIAIAFGLVACGGSQSPSPETVDSIVVNSPASRLFLGETMQLTAQPMDAAGQPVPGIDVAWESSDPSIASIDSDGFVTAIAVGDVVVSAKAEGKSASVPLAVASSE
jgi:uncharacterized protein YjdB